MNIQHKGLAAGKWRELPFIQQMGNLGSEVERCLKQKKQGNAAHKQLALERALELFDLTIQDPKNIGRLRELTRLRETFIDFIEYDNQYLATEALWSNYFLAFGHAARNKKNVLASNN